MMKEIYGRYSTSSLTKRDLILSLGSKLHQRLDTIGLTGSQVTSKVMVTSSSLPYYQLTCSGLRMKDAGCSGEQSNRISWRTPTASDTQGGARWAIPRGALDTFKSTLKNAYLAANHFGRMKSGLRVQKGKAFFLNPELSRFVMGYPTDWSCYVATEMP